MDEPRPAGDRPARPAALDTYLPPGSGVALTVAWAGLASAAPTRTYHLAPLLAVLAWPLMARARGGRCSPTAAVTPVLGSLAVTGLTAVLLDVTDRLAGPALVGGSAFGEAVPLIALGGLLGARTLTRRRAGVLVGLLADQPGR